MPLELVVLFDVGRSEDAVCGDWCVELETREVRDVLKPLLRLERENNFCMLMDLRRPFEEGPLGRGMDEPMLSWRLSCEDMAADLLRSFFDEAESFS